MDNIVEFPRPELDHAVLEFTIECGSVDEARRSIECLEATLAIADNLLNKTDAADGVKLATLQRLFEAFHSLVLRDRGIQPLCSLPKFRPEPPDGAA
jgi:hypothetical protein